ncbi:MAG: Acyltransferase [Cyanobacteria bacterium RYN_339]|nr:Acyltransferase [Cyanobacteria bacterium RYN_339]
MAKIVIFGAGDIARLAHFYFTTDSPHEVVAFTVDAAYRELEEFQDLPVVAFEELPARFPPGEYQLFIALSYAKMNQVRAGKYHAAKALGYTLASYVSSRCTYLAQTPPGDNCFILEDNTVQPFVTIGSDVTLWSGNHIGHDSTIADHTFIASHVVVSGHVHIGPNCFIGVNATLRNSITLAPMTLVGAGAVIMKDTKEKGVYLPQRAELFGKPSDEIAL